MVPHHWRDKMEELEALKAKLFGVVPAMPGIIKTSFEDLKSTLEDMNIGQLEKGLRADGSILPNYSFASVHVYGKRPGPMTLHDKGGFWRGITLKVNDDSIEFEGHDMKTAMLQLRYGDDIIGITDDNQQIVDNDYLPPLVFDGLNRYFDIQ